LKTETWYRYYTQSLLGATLLEQKRYAEAEPLLISGYEGMQKNKQKMIDDDRESMQNAEKWLVEVFKRQGKTAKAAEWAQKTAQ
jgi:eukaryotic-like serine/threonine-protein kinase